MASDRERTIQTEWPPLVGEVNANLDSSYHVVSTTDPYDRILGFLYQRKHLTGYVKLKKENIYFVINTDLGLATGNQDVRTFD
jgi:hypothetical protein